MRVKVLLYADTDNPQGIPNAWPAEVEVLESGDSTSAPWKEMEASDYDAYRAFHQAAYDAWFATQPLDPSVPGDDS